MQALEKMLDSAFKNVPSLPEEARKGLATALPWMALVGGVLSLIVAWNLYRATTALDAINNFTNQFAPALTYGPSTSAIGVVGWLGIAILVAQAVLSFVAFPSLRVNKKAGWNLMLLMLAGTIVYGVLTNLFTAYYGVNIGGLIFTLIGSAFGFYLLYQVRSYFGGGAAVVAKPAAPTASATPAAKADKKE